MPRKLFSFIARRALLGLALMPLFAAQMPRIQIAAASQTDQSQKSLDAEMTRQQNEMKALTMKLDESFQVIADAFVAHREALKELTGAIAQHEQAMTQMMKKCS